MTLMSGIVRTCFLCAARSSPANHSRISSPTYATSGVLDAFDHQEFTFGRLLQQLSLPRDPSRMPLVSVTFNLDPPLSDIRFTGLTHEIELNPRQHYQFDLGFNLVDEGPAGLRVECDYNPDLFDAATIRRWIGHYRTLLESLAVRSLPRNRARATPLLTASKRRAYNSSSKWNDTWLANSRRDLHRLIDAIYGVHVAQAPDAIAIIDGDQRTTYAELNSPRESHRA